MDKPTGTQIKELCDGNECPVCGGDIKSSGFNGNLFCWGKCYCYLKSKKFKELLSNMGG